MSESIPTYDPESIDTDVSSVDWESLYEGEDSRIPADRIVTQGHSIVNTSWPHEEPLEEQMPEQAK